MLLLLLLGSLQDAPAPGPRAVARPAVDCTLRVVTVDPKRVDPGILKLAQGPPANVSLDGIVRDDVSPCRPADTSAAAGQDVPAAADPFDAALSEAERNEQAGRGGAFQAAFNKDVGAAYAPRLNECAQKAGGLPKEPIDVLLRLGANGSVDDGLVRPRTPFAECFLELSRKASYPKPPRADYWTAIRVRFGATP